MEDQLETPADLTPKGPSDLTAALEASLEELDNPNPLSEVDPNSLSVLWEWITDKLALGLPEEITDAKLLLMVRRYRTERLRWDQEEETKTKHTGRKGTKAANRAPQAPAKTLEW